MSTLHGILPQSAYRLFSEQTASWVANDYKKALAQNDLQKLNTLKAVKGGDEPTRTAFAKSLMKQMISAQKDGRMGMQKAGVNTALGYNFYDLRGPAFLEYPVNVPFRNSMARIGKQNDGFGTAAHWKATRNPGYSYGGVAEGKRVQQSTPDENDYVATYKEIGDEGAATFSSEFASEGYTDVLGDEHLRGLHRLWLKEEALILLGNSGTATGNNGFALGTASTPVAAAPAVISGVTSTIPNTTSITVACVMLTAMGNPTNAQYGYGSTPTVAGGLVPSFTYTAPGTGDTVTVNGGTSAISALSNTVVTTAANTQAVVASIPTANLKRGVYGYAWFVSSNGTPTLANSYLYAITTNPSVTVNSVPSSSNQPGNATGLNADHSFNVTDFDGLLTYTATTSDAYYKDLQGASLTSSKDGRVSEIEVILESIFQNFQAQPTAIWGDVLAVQALDAAIRYSGTQASGFRFNYVRDSQNNLLGGYVVSGYQARYAVGNPNGGNVIPIMIHPMIPAGTLYFDIAENPYPHSRLDFTRGLFVQRDYYSIEWPLVTRQWTFGTYTHEVLAHKLPWITAVLTGIGAFSQSN